MEKPAAGILESPKQWSNVVRPCEVIVCRECRAVLFKLFFVRTTFSSQNMYTYHCHNTKHVHVPLSQYKTCTLTTVTIQNMYTYHCHNTKHVGLPLGTANINVYFQDSGLPECFAVETSNFAVAASLI